ncbi:MAG: cysteine hydrolase family protein [Planctomycetota bacterium]|jgi:nicotinamidase-related amidase
MIMPVIALGRKRIVVDVDTQRHFFADHGMVCVRNHRRVLANILRVVNWARLQNVRMISTVQVLPREFHYRSSHIINVEAREKIRYTLRKRHASFYAQDCTDLLPDLWDRYDQIIFYKRCFDPFEEPRADRMLSELRADEFILIGALTEGAVKATALGLLARQKNVTVLVDATGSYDDITGQVGLRLLRERGAKLIKTHIFLCASCLNLQHGPV